MKIRVYYEDTDTSGFVYHSKYLNFCERARSELFFSRGISPIDGNSHFVVKEISAKYLKPAKFGEVLQVHTEVLELRKASIKLLQTIFRDEVQIFSAEILLAHLINSKPSKIPENILEIF